jgi:hypothetical protein
MGSPAKESRFDSQLGQKHFLFSIASTGSEAYPACPVGTWGSFPHEVKRLGQKLTINLCLVPRSRMVELYLQAPIHLHHVVLNLLTPRTTVPCILTAKWHYIFDRSENGELRSESNCGLLQLFEQNNKYQSKGTDRSANVCSNFDYMYYSAVLLQISLTFTLTYCS